jgi:integrase
VGNTHAVLVARDGRSLVSIMLTNRCAQGRALAQRVCNACFSHFVICKHQAPLGLTGPDDYLFLPHLRDCNYTHWVLNFHFNWILAETGLKKGPHGQPRSPYSLRHSAITFRLLYGQGIDLLTLARNTRTSVDVIKNH